MKSILSTASVVFALLGSCSPTVFADAASKGMPEVVGFHAYMFLSKTGAWSDDILKDGLRTQLGNVIADPGGPKAIWIVVEVAGPPVGAVPGVGDPLSGYKLQLIAREPKAPKPLLDSTQALGLTNDRGTRYVGFALYPGFCKPVELQAILKGPHRSTPVKESLDFACYE